MISINLKTNSLIKNFYNSLKASHHCKKNSKTYFQYKSKLNIDKNVDNHIKLIISEIMSYELINNNFSKKFIVENIILILEQLYDKNAFNLNNENFKKLYFEYVESFENEINTKINDFKVFEYIGHVKNLKIPKKIEIGDVILFTFKSSTSDLAYINDDKYHFEEFFKENEVYARTKVYGSRDYSIKKSEVKIKIALNILKLFQPPHFCNFNLDGEVVQIERRDYILLNENLPMFIGTRSIGGFFYSCEIEENELEKYSFYMNILSSLLKNKNKSSFENRLLTSVYWFGEAISYGMMNYRKEDNKHSHELENFEYFHTYPKLLNLVIALETVFVFGNEHKSESISSKVSSLISNPGYEKFIYLFLNQIYDIRSKLVHSGITYISKDDLDTLINYTRAALQKIILINHLAHDKIQYFDKIYSK